MPRRVLLALIFGGLVASNGPQVFGLLLAPIADDLGLSVAQLGGLRVIQAVAGIAGGIVLTPIIDRYPRRRMLMTSLALNVTGALIASAAIHPLMFACYFVFDGLAAIVLVSVLLATPSDFASGRELDRSIGLIIASFAAAGLSTVPLAGFLSDAYSWRAGYLLAAAIAGTVLMLVAWAVPTTPFVPEPHHHLTPRESYRMLARYAGFLPGLTGAFLRFAIYNAVVTYSGALLVKHYDVPVRMAGIYFSAGAATFMLGAVGSGAAIARIGTPRMLVPGGLATAAMIASALALDPPLWLAGLLLIGGIALMSVQENASTVLLLRLAPHTRGAAMSLNELAAAGGALVGIGCGALALRGAGFAGIGVLVLVAGVAALLVTRAAVRAAPFGTVVEVGAIGS